MRFERGARVPRLPHARAAAEALRGGRCARPGRRVRWWRRCDPTPWSPTSSRSRRRWRRELEGVPVATVIPHLDPRTRARLAAVLGGRAAAANGGRARGCGARCARRPTPGCERGRIELNETRRRLGLPPLERRARRDLAALALVATFPQLEYPRAVRPPATHVVGPLLWERRPRATSCCPPGDAPLVLVAPSTSQDPEHRLLRAALAGLADVPVRVLAAWNRRPLGEPVDVRRNARLVEWVSYSRDDAAVRRRGLPRRPRHGRPRAGLRLRRRRRARGRRHERERGAHRLGRRRRARPAAPVRTARGAPGGRARAGRAASARARGRAGCLVALARPAHAGVGAHRGSRGGPRALASPPLEAIRDHRRCGAERDDAGKARRHR